MRPPLANLRAQSRPGTHTGVATAALWTLGGVVSTVACQAGIVVVLAHLSTADALADYALTTAVGAPIWIFVGLQLPALKATDIRATYRLQEYLAVRLLSALVGTVATCGLTMASGATDGRLWTVCAVSLWRAADFIAELGYAEFQFRGRADLQAKAQALRSVLGITAFTAVLAAFRSPATAFAALASISALILVVWDFFGLSVTSQAPAAPPTINRATWGLVRWGLPLGLVVVLAALTSNIPRYSIEGWLGHAALGSYSAIATLAAIGTVAISALNQVASPRMARAWADGDVRSAGLYVAGLLAASLAIGAVAMIVIVLVGNPALVLVLGPRFDNQQTLMLILLAAATLTGITNSLGAAATAFRTTRTQVLINLATLCVSASAAPVLVRRFGLEGAAASQVVTGLFALVMFAGLVANAMRKRATEQECATSAVPDVATRSDVQLIG
jgi:O-antigen/teichoic acid export membrane protein